MRNVILALAFLSLPAFANEQDNNSENGVSSQAPYDYESCIGFLPCRNCLLDAECPENSDQCSPTLKACIDEVK
jgi:hypothetical protein